MKPNIVIITNLAFTKRDHKRFGISILRKKFNVFIFDFTKNFSKKLANYKYSQKTYKCKGYYSISSLSSFIKLVDKHDFSNCINYIFDKKLETGLLKIFRRNKVPIVKIQTGLVIGSQYPRTFIQNLHMLSFKFTDRKRFITFVCNQFKKIKNKFSKVDNFKYDKVIVTGKIGLQDKSIGLNTKIIYAHSFDYNNYLESNKNPRLINKKNYAVFLDQYLPMHPDAPTFFGVSPRCTPEKYYPALNNFFEAFEKNFGMKVVVCAHPKSDYENNYKFLYGRKFVKNKTVALVKNSKLVFAHGSTTIAYAILYKKPLVFLLSDEYLRSFDNYTPAIIAKKLNSPCFNIDDKNNYSKIRDTSLFKIDKKKYKIYMDNYIKYPSKSNKNFWEIFNEKI